jgi:two-component system chemotaxis response regulator CheB
MIADKRINLVATGSSLGGLQALRELLSGLPNNFPAALAIVQHRKAAPDDKLIGMLQKASAMPVVEVEDKQPILPGYVFLAPADYHMLVEDDHFALSAEEPVQYALPSIDVFFESAADSYGPDVIGIVLTGNLHDGAKGLAAIKNKGGMTVVQDPETAEARSMPDAAIAGAKVDKVLTLPEIAPFLVQTLMKDKKHG